MSARCTIDADWKPLAEDISWADGRDIVLLAHEMEVQARYCPGEWSEDTPVSPREYSGAVWSCFDDEFQIEIEETSHDPAEWHHGPATHWRDLTPRPAQGIKAAKPARLLAGSTVGESAVAKPCAQTAHVAPHTTETLP